MSYITISGSGPEFTVELPIEIDSKDKQIALQEISFNHDFQERIVITEPIEALRFYNTSVERITEVYELPTGDFDNVDRLMQRISEELVNGYHWYLTPSQK